MTLDVANSNNHHIMTYLHSYSHISFLILNKYTIAIPQTCSHNITTSHCLLWKVSHQHNTPSLELNVSTASRVISEQVSPMGDGVHFWRFYRAKCYLWHNSKLSHSVTWNWPKQFFPDLSWNSGMRPFLNPIGLIQIKPMTYLLQYNSALWYVNLFWFIYQKCAHILSDKSTDCTITVVKFIGSVWP